MAIIKKNIWFIFYVLSLIATLLFATVCYATWNNAYLKHQTAQENIVELMANATHSLFNTYERLTDILGIGLLENNLHNIQNHVQPLIDNPEMIALGITTPKGKFIYATSDKDPTNIPNLLELPQTRDSFLQALASDGMVFGRVYFSPPLQKWGMPIRKTIRNEAGEAQFVITTVLKHTSTFDALLSALKHRHYLNLSVIRDHDLYYQYHSNGHQDYERVYNAPFSKETMEKLFTTVFDTHGITPKELKSNQLLVSTLYQQGEKGYYLASLKYNNTYHLWILSQTPLSLIVKEFVQKSSLYLLIFLGIGSIFFYLFRIIAKAEEERRKELFEQATHDQLTLLPNRYYLKQCVQQWIHKDGPAFSMIYVDMDHFKTVNDSFGHHYGDYVLIQIAKRLNAIMPPHSLIVRYGGDEFVLLVLITKHEELMHFASKLIETLSEPYVITQLHFNLGASVGIACYPEHGHTIDMLLRASDIAMYESKKIKNSAHIFASEMQEGFLKNITIEQELRKAISNHELFMVYQPQITAEGFYYGAEALIRWNSPLLGNVPPDHFIPLAEASGLMLKIGRLIVEMVCNDVNELHQKLQHPFHVSINISVRQFMDPHFLEHMLHVFKKTQTQYLNITLEVTENLFIEDLHYILPLLHQIRDMGIEISMDDFGTGYSSLSMLRQLPINELKIDKSFVDTIAHDVASAKMIQNIITIGKNLNMHLLAEGVETKEQKDILTTFGCDRFQGYYFSKPLPKEELFHFFSKHPFTCKE
ncbi:bifunctional diguanylate cyclase/phosphodiesterase [Sulfurospirillum barnesii]|uniref:Diguanylate cyclase (GGDEF) domain-containing protein n=1 Tax=Sulfurospirillum barnesii (strain ATCC 700032 / DSM 10660 / SES-3) TaxID=760154 RepID=I3XYN2_SULBS|nr:EAL domain-containing protein [Sulfurospirillum barnesii]AFL69056.1 diguanylate cyclase (GGDEF) domain-containing protein [Sulfurospirillum barnesii SES-3]